MPHSALIPDQWSPTGALNSNSKESLAKIEVVDFISLIADSAKLNYLDRLLIYLKKRGHRVIKNIIILGLDILLNDKNA